MSKRVHVKPRKDRLVYNPETKRNIDSLGAMVILDSYWHRQARDGDIDVLENSSPALAEKALDEARKQAENKKEGKGKNK